MIDPHDLLEEIVEARVQPIARVLDQGRERMRTFDENVSALD